MSTGSMADSSPVPTAEQVAGTSPAMPTPEPEIAIEAGPPPSLAEFRKRFTVAEFERLYEVGFLDDEADHFELIDGDLVAMARVRPTHASTISRLVGSVPAKLGDRATCLVQVPLFLGEESQPQPDFALAKYREDGYVDGHPRPDETRLVIEVMDTSHRYDGGVKLPRYAAAGIPETWLVDLPGKRVEVHRRPVEGVYLDRSIFLPGDSISPEAFPDLVLSVSHILGVPAGESES